MFPPLKEQTVEINDEGTTRAESIRVYELEALGITTADFIDAISSSFEKLEINPYDKKLLELLFLRKIFPDAKKRLDQFQLRYYRGDTDLNEIADIIKSLTDREREKFYAITSTRKNAIARFDLGLGEEKPSVGSAQGIKSYTQGSPTANDFQRPPDRRFPGIATEVTEHPLFKQLLPELAQIAYKTYVEVHKISPVQGWIIAHQVECGTNKNEVGIGSPEGIHQDRADFTFTALVIERLNITGGVSRVYAEANGILKEVYSTELQPGQLLCHRDNRNGHNSGLWHFVDPIKAAAPNKPGKRRMFGFDIYFEQA